MRYLIFILLLFISISCTSTKNALTDSNKLNGSWVPVKQEIGGTVLPKSAFESQKLIINDSTYTFTAESTDKGIVRIYKNKMDIYGKEGVNAGKHFTAIYKYEDERLTICYNLTGNNYPEAFETNGKPTYFLSVFEKEKGN